MGKAEDLLLLADADIRTAAIILNTGNDELLQNNAAYHTEQAVEKIAKAVLEKAGIHGGIGHDIAALLADMDKAGIKYPDWLRDNAFAISRWATTIRYNVNFKADHDQIAVILEKAKEWLEDHK